MEKSLCIVAIFTFLLLLCSSCQEEPTAVEGDVSYQQESGGLAKGRPPGDSEKPVIVSLSVKNMDGSDNTMNNGAYLPGQPVTIQYNVTDNVGVTEISVDIIYDENKDGKYEILFSEHVFATTVTGANLNGDGGIVWDGTVNRQYQPPFPIFNHLATTDPDQYIVYFTAKDGANNTFSNWISYGNLTVGTDTKVYVNSPNVDPFHITQIQASQTSAQSKKGKFAAQLSARVVCNAPQFRGGGQWRQWNGTAWGPLTNYDGCPNGSVYGDESGVAVPGCAPLVNKGRYAFFVKVLYHTSLSYDPQNNEGITYPDGFNEQTYLDYTFAEVEVP